MREQEIESFASKDDANSHLDTAKYKDKWTAAKDLEQNGLGGALKILLLIASDTETRRIPNFKTLRRWPNLVIGLL